MQVFRQYVALKDVVGAINEAFGILFLCLLVGCLPFYPTWTGIVIFRQSLNWYQLLTFADFFGSLFLVLAVAADLNFKVREAPSIRVQLNFSRI